jgi:hypothetical protein
MMVRAAWSLAAVAASAIAGLAAGRAVAGTATTEPPSGSVFTAPGCAEIGALLDSAVALGAALGVEDASALATALGDFRATAAAATAVAPDEISDDVLTASVTAEVIGRVLDGVDLGDAEAVSAALDAIPMDEATAGVFDAVGDWAVENCGYALPGTDVGEVDEPTDCESLDAAAAADAAGVEVDVSDLDGSADVNLPGLWTKSCSYGNGAMSLSTLSFAAVEDAEQFYADNLDAADGVVLDVALGSLPASSLVIRTGVASGAASSVPATAEAAVAVTPTVQVAVFEAPVPFSVTFTGADVDPAAAVAAAEAVAAALGTETPASTAVAAPTTS